MSSCITVCSTLDRGTWRVNAGRKADEPIPIDKWFENVAYRELSYTKEGQLKDFEVSFLEEFSPYFEGLKKCVSKLFDIMFPLEDTTSGNTVRLFQFCRATHDEMIHTLTEAYDGLPNFDEVIDADSAPSKRAKISRDLKSNHWSRGRTLRPASVSSFTSPFRSSDDSGGYLSPFRPTTLSSSPLSSPSLHPLEVGRADLEVPNFRLPPCFVPRLLDKANDEPVPDIYWESKKVAKRPRPE